MTRLDTAKPEVRSSRSLWDSAACRISRDLSVAAEPRRPAQGYVPGPEDQRLRLVERSIDLGEEGRFLVAVAGDAAEIDDETRGFDRALLDHLRRAGRRCCCSPPPSRSASAWRRSIASPRDWPPSARAPPNGSTGRFPVEIAPLARETNALIDANREIVERARTHVGNLAHALKTPLSVMMNEASAQRRRSACR